MTFIGAAGHSLTISGATHGPERESDDAILITDSCLAVLAANPAPTALVPHALDYVATVKWINDRSWPTFSRAFEFHKNAGSEVVDGIEIYYEAGNKQMQIEAIALCAAIARHTGLPNRLARPDTSTRFGKKGLYFCRGPKVPSLLIEMGWIEQDHDERKLGRGAALAILEVYGDEDREGEEEMEQNGKRHGHKIEDRHTALYICNPHGTSIKVNVTKTNDKGVTSKTDTKTIEARDPGHGMPLGDFTGYISLSSKAWFTTIKV